MALSLATVGAKITASFMNLIIAVVNQQGSTLIKPSSVPSGASVSTLGRVDFTLASTVDVRGVFSAAYDVYEIEIDCPTLTASAILTMTLAVAGTPSAANYWYQVGSDTGSSGTVHTSTASGSTSLWQVAPGAGTSASTTIKLYGPGKAAISRMYSAGMASVTASAGIVGHTSGSHNVTTAYDGFVLTPVAATTITGSLTVRGMNRG